MVGTAGLPHVIIRFYTVPRVRDARISAGWALLFIAFLYTTAPAVAVFARTNLIDSVQDVPYESVPEWFTNWEATGLLSFEDVNGDGRIQYVGPESSMTNELCSERRMRAWNDRAVLAALPSFAKNWRDYRHKKSVGKRIAPT